MASSYEERVKQQIAQYADMPIHDLPDIFHVWSDRFVKPGLLEIFNVSSVAAFFGEAYLKAKPASNSLRKLFNRNKTGRILSIGCGDGALELGIVKYLLERGESDFIIHCVDLSPLLLERLRVAAEEQKYTQWVKVVEADLNLHPQPGKFDMVMANHSLHHIVELESIFDYANAHLTTTGIFAANDMIGRNGHMRWPETAAILKSLWPMLNDKEKWHAGLQRLDDTFVDHDCSTEGFEGIRAQDILPLLLERFHPYKFFGFGGFIDLFVDRGYGRAYDINNKDDVAWIEFLATLNDMLLDIGAIKPTVMLAYFTKKKLTKEEIYFNERRAATSVRSKDPDWLRFVRAS